ncbi:9386_t:CDS:2 [Funneliformis geosporum]|nr:9386_t:CDS:2 [Funneliformis geosporum]
MKYIKYKEKNRLECLDLSFQYEGKDRLVSTNGDDVFNDFEITEKSKADLVLGLPWRQSHLSPKKPTAPNMRV